MKRSRKPKPLPTKLPVVWAHAVIDLNGVLDKRPVELFENLPGWWGRVPELERTMWLRAYFTRKLQLKPGETLVSVSTGAAE